MVRKRHSLRLHRLLTTCRSLPERLDSSLQPCHSKKTRDVSLVLPIRIYDIKESLYVGVLIREYNRKVGGCIRWRGCSGLSTCFRGSRHAACVVPIVSAAVCCRNLNIFRRTFIDYTYTPSAIYDVYLPPLRFGPPRLLDLSMDSRSDVALGCPQVIMEIPL